MEQSNSKAIDEIRRSVNNLIENNIHNDASEKAFNLSVGIHIHAFYLDVSEELIEAASTVPGFKHIYLSTCDNKNYAALEAQLSNSRFHPKDYTIAVVPNRGRNFGPMLVEFKDQLKSHDIILHLHTKKSLRTGVEQVKWRKNSWEGLCGTKSISSKIISEFLTNPKLGVVAAAPLLDFSSYWWKTWLSVGHLLTGYFNRLGINEYPKKGFIHFPIGSMCWARTEALLPLLNTNWKYEDFPDEPCPDDGTILHVIERSIGTICEHQGFEYREVESDNECGINIIEPKLLMNDYAVFANYIKGSPRERVLSFDFFDTLFTRNSLTPEDIQHFIGFYLKENFKVYNGEMFIRFRKKAESMARENTPSCEVGLDQIYSYFPKVSNWSSDLIDLAKKKELDIEKTTLKPRYELIDFVKFAKKSGCRVIIVSDTYLSSSFIREILEKWNVSELFDFIYVSSEQLVRKDWGSMWPIVAEKEHLNQWDDKFLHIGDNEQSDIQQPLRNGIRALGILNPAVMYDVLGYKLPNGWKTGKSFWGDGLVIGPAIATLCNSPIIKNDDASYSINTFRDLGYIVFGPILFGFSKWLIEQCDNNKSLNRYAFLARDGWFLKSAYDRVCQTMPAGAYVPSVYLKVSRQALFASSCDISGIFDLLIESGDYKGSMRNLFLQRLNFDLGVKSNQLIIDLAEDKDRVYEIFNERKSEIERFCIANRDGFLQYLDKINFNRDAPDSIIDVGYSGTIQFLIQKILDKGITGYYLVVNNKANRVGQYLDGKAYGFFGDGRDPLAPLSVLQAYSMLLESILIAPHGKVSGYNEHGDPIVSCVDKINNIEFSNGVMDGVFNYIDDLLLQYGTSILHVPCHSDIYTLPFNDLVSGKLTISGSIKDEFIVEDKFCGNDILNSINLYDLKC